MKAGSWLHNTVGIFIVFLSIYLGIENWQDNKIASIFFIVFGLLIGVLVYKFTKKRQELKNEHKK